MKRVTGPSGALGAAGMTKGALYFHFASKDGLVDAVQEQAHAVL
ncbi:TetR family transcriptional regulator, partial [Streptomyces werraensis]